VSFTITLQSGGCRFSIATLSDRPIFKHATLCVSAVLAIALYLSIRLSVTSRSSVKTAVRIELVFDKKASFDLACLSRIARVSLLKRSIFDC